MRRQLLALLHIKEFALDARFVDPCKSIVLRDVVCTNCGAVADVDVCREAASATDGDAWRCQTCSTEFDCNDIEQRLLARAAAAVQAFQVQDLKCSRCGAVSTGGMAGQCGECGDALVASVTPAALHGELNLLRSVARFHGLQLLNETVSAQLGSGE